MCSVEPDKLDLMNPVSTLPGSDRDNAIYAPRLERALTPSSSSIYIIIHTACALITTLLLTIPNSSAEKDEKIAEKHRRRSGRPEERRLKALSWLSDGRISAYMPKLEGTTARSASPDAVDLWASETGRSPRP